MTEHEIDNIATRPQVFGLTPIEFAAFVLLGVALVSLLAEPLPIWGWLPISLVIPFLLAKVWKKAKEDQPYDYAIHLLYWLTLRSQYDVTPDIDQSPLFVRGTPNARTR